MAKTTQFNTVDLGVARAAIAALPPGTDMHHPDVAVLHDVYYSVHLAKPIRRSRRRFNKAISNIYEMNAREMVT